MDSILKLLSVVYLKFCYFRGLVGLSFVFSLISLGGLSRAIARHVPRNLCSNR